MKDSVKAVVAVFLLAAAGLVAMFFLRSRSTGDLAYYYDQSEQKLYVAKAAQIPPLSGVGGDSGDGVVAVVYVCGQGGKADRKIAYLMTYSPELAEAMKQAEASIRGEGSYPEPLNDRAWVSRNTLVRAPEDAEWHPMGSPEGQAVLAILSAKCDDGSYPRVCSPAD